MRNWKDCIGVGIAGFILGIIIFIAVLLIVGNIETKSNIKIPSAIASVYYVRYSTLVKDFKGILEHTNLKPKQRVRLFKKYRKDLLNFAYSYATQHQAVVVFSPYFAASHDLVLRMKDITPIFVKQEKAKRYYKAIIEKLKKTK